MLDEGGCFVFIVQPHHVRSYHVPVDRAAADGKVVGVEEALIVSGRDEGRPVAQDPADC